MSKIIVTLSLMITMMVFTRLLTKPVYADVALPSCPSLAQTTPTLLLNSHREATFTINVGNNQNYSGYKMDFICGLRIDAGPIKIGVTGVDAVKIGSTSISVDLDKSGTSLGYPCEFAYGPHTIIVKAVTSSGPVDQCIASYNVAYSGAQCQLEINPKTNITSATPISVSGKNLTPEGRFVFFFDNDAIDVANNPLARATFNVSGDVTISATGTFGPKSIPQQYITPGRHSVSLRQRKFYSGPFDLIWNAAEEDEFFFDPPLCSAVFRVGDPTNPGSALPAGIDLLNGCSASEIQAGRCTSSEGRIVPKCTDDPNHPAIATAIGCIHTNPAELVKDFMTFIIAISGGLAFLMMLIGAFGMLRSAGNPDSLHTGKDRLTSGIIGLLFVLFAVLLLQIIGAGILSLPDFKP